MNDRIISYIISEISIEPFDTIGLDEDLLGSGIVDSLGMMKLVLFLENEFIVKIPPEDMTVENFGNVQNISAYLSHKLD
ncbi:MAG TPA: acyl carrier protein [Pricia antarctica]|uniref:Acyl carrier protein n=1 Tax=Pricia antarctica TaxID=641691 RepID=A0A831QTC9_9FLAO|nr:acyl carrier protein [Pricia antarctica]